MFGKTITENDKNHHYGTPEHLVPSALHWWLCLKADTDLKCSKDVKAQWAGKGRVEDFISEGAGFTILP